MMREVVGAFGSFSKLSEALDELCSEGIAPDRVRVATACAPPSNGSLRAIDGKSTATHWRTAEYAGHGEHLGVVESHDYLFETTDFACDQATADSYASAFDSFENSDYATVKICVKDSFELRAVCDIFSRLGMLDIDAAECVA
jgi:hypothetical protein